MIPRILYQMTHEEMYFGVAGKMPRLGDTLFGQIGVIILVTILILCLVWMLDMFYFGGDKTVFIKRYR